LKGHIDFLEFPDGTEPELRRSIAAARRYEELVAWQLAVELRDRIPKSTRSGPASRDRKFLDQIQDSAASSPRNLAEGFLANRIRL
jgi:hypothetical protein